MVTLKASDRGLKIAERALELDERFYSKQDLIKECQTYDKDNNVAGRSTVDNFFKQKKITKSCFIRICRALKLDWLEIAELEKDRKKLTEYTLSELLKLMKEQK